MAKPEIDISLEGVWPGGSPARTTPAAKGPRSRIDIPLDDRCPRAGCGADITERELEFVNRHHEQYKEQRRRAREGT